MSMYSEQDLYKFMERIAVALERLASSPVTGYPAVKAGALDQAQMRPTPSPGLIQHAKPSSSPAATKPLSSTASVEDLKALPIDPAKKQ